MKDVIVPRKTEIINQYLQRHNYKQFLNEKTHIGPDELTPPVQLFDIPDLPYQPIRPSFDIIACDPPYGIRARAAKIASSEDGKNKTTQHSNSDKNCPNCQNSLDSPNSCQICPNIPPQEFTPSTVSSSSHAHVASYINRIRTQQSATHRAKHSQLAPQSNLNDTPEDITPDGDLNIEVDGNQINGDGNDDDNDDDNNNKDKKSKQNKMRRLFTPDDIGKQRYIPQTVHNPMENVLYDLFDWSAQNLPIGGKIVYLLPTSKSLPRDLLPNHPCFRIKYAASQRLPTWFNRWAIVMEKIIEYDHQLHCNWIQEQMGLGVPLWSTATTARARVLANQLHHFDVELLYQAKYQIDKYGYDLIGNDQDNIQ
jgi:tRNA G10  N-methylase Trm11